MITYLKNEAGFRCIGNWESKCWVKVECPTKEEIEFITKNYNVPLDFLQDISDIDEQPRIEDENGWHLIIIRIPHKFIDNDIPYITLPLGILYSDDTIITICYFSTMMLNDFIDFTVRKKINIKSHFDFILKILLSSTMWYIRFLKELNQQINIAEKKLERAVKNEELHTLLKIEKCLVLFITSLESNDTLLSKFKKQTVYSEIYDEDQVEDLEIEMKQAVATARVYSDILSGLMDAFASVISNNLNVIMKKLTTISIILMIPTLIASIFGMNVPNFLETNNVSFILIISVSFIISILGLLILKMRDWF